MTTIGARAKSYWSRHGVKLRSGVAEQDIVAFEKKFGVRLPQDVREFFAVVDGMDDSASLVSDDNGITFLPLGNVTPLTAKWTQCSFKDAGAFFIFADYSLSAHVYAIRLSVEANTSTSVIVVYDQNPIKVADSYAEFMHEYLSGNELVLFPQP
jgi:hypothetical protein